MNQTPQTKQIEKLLARFFDGATTNEEERTLYCFFKQPDLPAEWEPYRSMFDFFEQGVTAAPEPRRHTRRPLTRKLRFAIGIAASVLVLFTAGALWMHQRTDSDRIYVARNGVMLTDPDEQSATCREVAEQVRQQYLSIVSAFPDEQTRRAAMQVLYDDPN
jgi:hypothetical protein